MSGVSISCPKCWGSLGESGRCHCGHGVLRECDIPNAIGSRAYIFGPHRDNHLAIELVERYATPDAGAHEPGNPLCLERAKTVARSTTVTDPELDTLCAATPFVQISNNIRDYFCEPHLRVRSPTSEYLAKKIRPAEGDCLLDAGCSAGRYLLPHADTGAHLVGVDLSAFALSAANRAWRMTMSAPPPALIAADITELPLASETCTHVTSFVVLAYTPFRRALSEFHRVLRPGGTLLFTTEGPGFLSEALQRAPRFSRHTLALSRWWLGSRLLQAGLDWQSHRALSRLSSVTLFSSSDLERLLPKCGFKIRDISILRRFRDRERLIGVVASKV